MCGEAVPIKNTHKIEKDCIKALKRRVYPSSSVNSMISSCKSLCINSNVDGGEHGLTRVEKFDGNTNLHIRTLPKRVSTCPLLFKEGIVYISHAPQEHPCMSTGISIKAANTSMYKTIVIDTITPMQTSTFYPRIKQYTHAPSRAPSSQADAFKTDIPSNIMATSNGYNLMLVMLEFTSNQKLYYVDRTIHDMETKSNLTLTELSEIYNPLNYTGWENNKNGEKAWFVHSMFPINVDSFCIIRENYDVQYFEENDDSEEDDGNTLQSVVGLSHTKAHPLFDIVIYKPLEESYSHTESECPNFFEKNHLAFNSPLENSNFLDRLEKSPTKGTYVLWYIDDAGKYHHCVLYINADQTALIKHSSGFTFHFTNIPIVLRDNNLKTSYVNSSVYVSIRPFLSATTNDSILYEFPCDLPVQIVTKKKGQKDFVRKMKQTKLNPSIITSHTPSNM